MSGQNRLINSENTINGNSQQTLKEKLMNANEEAVKITEAGIEDENSGETVEAE